MCFRFQMNPTIRKPTAPVKVVGTKRLTILDQVLARADNLLSPHQQPSFELQLCSSLLPNPLTISTENVTMPKRVLPISSPNNTVPPPQKTSNFEAIHNVHRICNKSRTPCTHIYLQGGKKF